MDNLSQNINTLLKIDLEKIRFLCYLSDCRIPASSSIPWIPSSTVSPVPRVPSTRTVSTTSRTTAAPSKPSMVVPNPVKMLCNTYIFVHRTSVYVFYINVIYSFLFKGLSSNNKHTVWFIMLMPCFYLEHQIIIISPCLKLCPFLNQNYKNHALNVLLWA